MKPTHTLFQLTLLLALTGCKTAPKPIFTPEQVAAMHNAGFQHSDAGWTLGLTDKLLFDKNKSSLLPDTQKRIDNMAQQFSTLGLKHFRMEGHTDIYGKDSYNEALSLRRANVVADEWVEHAHIPASNVTVRGLGEKYPIASNQTAEGRAENRRVAIVITTP